MYPYPGRAIERSALGDDIPFMTRRAKHKTHLIAPRPSHQRYEEEVPPKGVREITYDSGGLRLKTWVYVPRGEEKRPHRTLIFYHGGFAFGASDMYDCLPFIERGFVVMTPWLRGENGMPGDFEMYYGELDDAVAAARWASQQPYVDKAHIYTFGHSAGGVLSALLSLIDDVPIRYGGSSGGVYGTDLFDLVPDMVPFVLSNPIERELRVLPGNIRWMKRRHYAYVGNDDDGVRGGVAVATREIAGKESPLKIIRIPGDHGTSFKAAAERFAKLIDQEP